MVLPIGEWIPTFLLDSKCFISLGMDSIAIFNNRGIKVYFMIEHIAKFLSDFRANEHSGFLFNKIRYSTLIDAAPSIFGRIISDVDHYIYTLAEIVGSKLKDKRLVLWYSGGKDSTSALYIILRLQELINFKLFVGYIHVPFLDGEENSKFIDFVERKFSIDIIRASIGKNYMYRLLMERGLPYRGYRWCTYNAKIKVMRKIKRNLNCDFEISAERIFESFKRFRSLREYAKQFMFISGNQFKPIFPLTILDIVNICKKIDLVHPHYLQGCSRISCSLCPYRTIIELNKTLKDTHDPGLVEELIRITHKKYHSTIGYDIYKRYALWRFSPKISSIILELKQHLSRREDRGICETDLLKSIAWIWHHNIEAPRITLTDIFSLVPNMKNPIYIVNSNIYLGDYSGF